MQTSELLVIDEQGLVTGLYDDCLLEIGTPRSITRASTVEPGPDGKWMVTLSNSPLNRGFAGKVIAFGLERREDALNAEREFINHHILGVI